MRLGGRHVVVVVTASILVAALALWRAFDRNALALRCADGSRPETVALLATMELGHGPASATITLKADSLEVIDPLRKQHARPVSAAEREAILKRLEHPKPLSGAINATAVIHVSKVCSGAPSKEVMRGSVGRRFSVGWFLDGPRTALRSLDPRPARIIAAAQAVFEEALANPASGE